MADPRAERPPPRRPATATASRRRPGPAGGVRRAQGGPGRRRLHQPGAAVGPPAAPADRPGRRLHHGAGLRHPPPPGDLRRRPRRLRGPAAGEGRGQGARRAAARRPPAALDAGARPRCDQHHRRPDPGPGRTGPGRVRQRRPPPGLRERPRRVGTPRRTRPGRGPGRLRLGRSQPSPLDRGGAVPGRRRGASSTPSSPPTTSHRGWSWSPGPAAPRPTSCPAHALGSRRTAWCWRAGTPARSRPSPKAGGCPGRGLPAGRPGAGPGDGRGAGRALAGPLRGSGRQGGPAGRAGVAAGEPAGGGGAAAAPGPARPASTHGRGRRARGRRGGRHPSGLAGRTASTGCSSTPPAPAWAPCAGARSPAGGAPPTTSASWSRCSAPCSSRRWTVSGPGEWSSTRPARRSSPRPPRW